MFQVRPLLDDQPVRYLIADRAYDSKASIAWLERREVEVVIRPRSTSPQRQVSWLLYRLRNTAASYSAFVQLTAATLWL